MKPYIAFCGAGRDATTICDWLAEQKDKYELAYQYFDKPNEAKKPNEKIFEEIKGSRTNFIILNHIIPNYGLVRLCSEDKDLMCVPLLVLARSIDEELVGIYAQGTNVQVSLFPKNSEELCGLIDGIFKKNIGKA